MTLQLAPPETHDLSLRTGRGGYDRLYRASDLLWPSTPGRMVALAAASRSPGRALDLGCGDGKNLVYLNDCGWSVDGIDISQSAQRAASRRLGKAQTPLRGSLRTDDVVFGRWERNAYDLVVAYGLLHCLSDEEATAVCRYAVDALRPGGLMAVATFNDHLPVPEGHGTGELTLRGAGYVFQQLPELEIVDARVGTIDECHNPIIGGHQHALTWALLRSQ